MASWGCPHCSWDAYHLSATFPPHVPTVTGSLWKTGCPKLSPPRCVYNLSWVLWTSPLGQFFANTMWTSSSFSSLWSSINKDFWKEWSWKNLHRKTTSSLKLEASRPPMLYCLHIYIICIYNIYMIYRTHLDISICLFFQSLQQKPTWWHLFPNDEPLWSFPPNDPPRCQAHWPMKIWASVSPTRPSISSK